ncbi:hypothetical protein KY290_036741 [Solanum tuberosum]|uniref:Uncharacterized protein n=1 Tax=Solanum tuberosum TaxID=4113 RepID=A0ABQ7TU14_SOLTU|nr:hypothetical protein KY289_036230 [Solanum tuberosum]KAH0639470.1 hypothetical protein KY285_036056 [Solanum tuberosum]KAH0738036.1 hypothetical protein KY290_036741 [Solanum tuberosum]
MNFTDTKSSNAAAILCNIRKLGNISWLANALDGSDLDVVAKSLYKFLHYGKMNKELVTEFLVMLLVTVL